MTGQAKNTQRSVTIYVRGNTVGDLEQKAYSKARLYFQDESVHLEIEAFKAISIAGPDEKYQADITVMEAPKSTPAKPNLRRTPADDGIRILSLQDEAVTLVDGILALGYKNVTTAERDSLHDHARA